MNQPPWLLRYGVAVLALGVVLLLRLLLEPLIAGQTPFLLLAGAVVVAAWFGGLGSGLLATALGALAADYFFLPPVGFTGLGVAFLPLLLFTLQGLLISSLVAALRSTRLRFDASWLLRYGVAVLALGVVLLLRLLLEPLIAGQTPFLLLAGAVVVAAWFGGLGSGLLATALGALAADYFFLPPVGFTGLGVAFLPLLLFTLQGLLISSLVAALRSARLRADAIVLETEKSLRESEELYRRVVEQAAENIFLVDLETKRIVRANAALHRSLGYSTEELRRLTLYDIVAHDRGSVDRIVKRTMGDRHRSIGDMRYRRKDGSLIDVEVGASAISYKGKEILCIVAHDVTERKKAEEERARLAAIVESSDDAILSKTLEGTITSWNAGARKLYGYSPEETLGRSITMLVPEDRPDEMPRILESVRRGDRIDHFETVRVTKDGKLIDVSLAVSPIEDSAGNVVGASAIARDITERKRVEERLGQSLKALLALYETGQVLSSSLEREEIGSKLLEVMGGGFGTTAAVINLSDERGEPLPAWRTFDPEGILASVRDNPEAEAARRLAFGAQEERLVEMERPDLQGERLAGLFVPLRVRGRVIGVLEAYISKVLAGEETVNTLSSLASQAASALENARLYEELTERERELHDLVGRIIDAQEEERRRVAYEVHDGFTQMASAAYRRLALFAEHRPPEATQDREELEDAIALVQQTIGEARRIIANLRPTTLDDFGLATAIGMQAQELRAEGYKTSYEDTLGEERLPAVLETTLFRVAQEALSNVRKHAETDRVCVALERHNGLVRLEVRDWGRGFEPTEVRQGGGPGERVGLSSMRERLVLLGGRLEIRSKLGAGTSVVAEVPLPAVMEAQEDGNGRG